MKTNRNNNRQDLGNAEAIHWTRASCTHATGACKPSDGFCTHATGACKLSDGFCTHATGACKLSDGFCTHATEACKLSDGLCTHATGACKLKTNVATRSLWLQKKQETPYIIYNVMKSPNLSKRVQVSEISAIASRWDTLLLEKCSEKETYLNNAISDFHNLTVRINETMNQMVTSDYEQLDQERRNLISSLSQFLKSFRKEKEGETKDSALLILNIFNHYGTRMLRKGVDGLTGMIDALLDDFNAPEAKTASAKVAHLDEKIEAVKNTNDQFKLQRLAYQMRRRELSNSVKTQQLKQQIVDMFNDVFIPYFSEKSKIEGGNFTTLHQTLTEIVNEANSLVKLRKSMAQSKRKKKKGDDEAVA